MKKIEIYENCNPDRVLKAFEGDYFLTYTDKVIAIYEVTGMDQNYVFVGAIEKFYAVDVK